MSSLILPSFDFSLQFPTCRNAQDAPHVCMRTRCVCSTDAFLCFPNFIARHRQLVSVTPALLRACSGCTPFFCEMLVADVLCAFCVFFNFLHLRQQLVSVAPIFLGAPSGCTVCLYAKGAVCARLILFCVFPDFIPRHQQTVSVSPALLRACSGCTACLYANALCMLD